MSMQGAVVGGGPQNVSVDETGHQAVFLKVFPYGVQMIVAHVEQVQEGMQTYPPMCVKEPSHSALLPFRGLLRL